MAQRCAPVIVLTGITGTCLRDAYPVAPEYVWAALTRDYERVRMHPDNMRLEATQPARILPDSVIEIAYKELVEELRHNLTPWADEPTPVYVFPYDWRQPLEVAEDQLKLFVGEVIERTRLLRHYFNDDYGDAPRVNLVGHSMGGLVIAGYLARNPQDHRVAKVATIATPFRGSIESIAKMTSGLSALTGGPPSSREREAARATPALYYLLPHFDGCLVDGKLAALGADIFDASIWQRSVIDTLEEYVRLYGLDKKNTAAQAQKLFAALLAQAGAHGQKLEGFKLKDANLTTDDWLCIAGADRATRVRAIVEKVAGGNQFTLDERCVGDQWSAQDATQRWNTGDGTVPLRAAVPPFLGAENLVCVRPQDYALFELGDRALASELALGFHGALPNMDLVHRLIARHFLDQKDKRANTWGLPAPGVSQWQPPIDLDQP
jgi:hypothetical protein